MVNFSMMERKLNPLFIGMFLAMIIFSPSIVYAQQVESQPLVLPDSFLYNFKLILENLQETVTIQEDRKAELFLKHAEERDKEARALEAQGKVIPIERIKQIQSDKIMKAEEIILRLEQVQSIATEIQDAKEERNILSQARTDAERAQLQDQIRITNDRPQFIEPDNSRPVITSSVMEQRPVKAIEIKPVDDIRDTDKPDEITLKLRDRLTNAFSTSEITEIRAKFTQLRMEDDMARKTILAKQLDDQVNNPLVSISCFGKVNTLSLSLAVDPVREIQEQCPILKTMSAEDLREIANSVR